MSGPHWCLWFHDAEDNSGMTVCYECQGAWYMTQLGWHFTNDVETIAYLWKD